MDEVMPFVPWLKKLPFPSLSLASSHVPTSLAHYHGRESVIGEIPTTTIPSAGVMVDLLPLYGMGKISVSSAGYDAMRN